MMAPTHTLTGWIIGAATAPLVADTLPGQLAWTALCGGAALWVDLDQRSSKASHAWGTPTLLLSDFIGWVARGHRFGTHDLILGPGIGALVTWAACQHLVGRWLMMSLMFGITLRSLAATKVLEDNRRRTKSIVLRAVGAVTGCNPGQLTNMAGSLLVSAIFLDRIDATLLPVVVALGAAGHIAGDWLSKQGIPKPIVWIWNRRARWKATKYKTDSAFEKWAVIPGHLIVLVGIVLGRAG